MIFNDDSGFDHEMTLQAKTSKHTITQQDLKHQRAGSASPHGSRPGSRFGPRSGIVTGWQKP